MKSLEKAQELKQELDELRPLSKEDEQRIMQKFRLDWNYHSNHLEGNSLTYGETKALILFGITAQGKSLKDHIEITGHNEAVEWILEVIKEDRPLTENFIRELHKLILKEPYEVDAITPDGKPTKRTINIGEYKTTPNHVKTKTGETFYFATPEETPAKMHDLLDWYKEKTEQPELNPILLAADFHYRFICIHPFDDGNGRTARILMNFILMRYGYPPVVIKTEDKENYFAALQQADAGIFEPFVAYIGDNLNHSLNIMIKGAKGESVEEPDDLEKEIALLDQKLKGIGEQVTVLKNAENIRKLLDESITRVLQHFYEKGNLLKKFYLSRKYLMKIDNSSTFTTFSIDHKILQVFHPLTLLDVIEKRTTLPLLFEISYQFADIKKVDIHFNYESFNNKEFSEFNYKSTISFSLKSDKYQVSNINNIHFEKPYSEQLTEEEISLLVNSEIRKHKEFIEQKIKESK